MIESWTPTVYFSALVLFNLFCLLGVVAALAITFSTFSIKSRVQRTLDLLDEKIEATTEITYSFAEALVSFLAPKPRTLLDTVARIFKSR